MARAWSSVEPENIRIPSPGALLPSSAVFSLPSLKAVAVDPKDPFRLDFVVDALGHGKPGVMDKDQVNLLIRYFLSFLTIPEEELWVNLSPYEKDRIITPAFEMTHAGRDMLEEDYILKQLASSLSHPDQELGKVFWKRVFERAKVEYGSTDIPINTFNKVWVLPAKAVVYEQEGSAFIAESRLKVLVEEDYLSMKKNENIIGDFTVNKEGINRLSSEITREIIIPELEREVNEGRYFASLRQMFNALILAIWFKKRLKETLINQVYVDQKKTLGIALNEAQVKERIYGQYLKALKKGAYNFVREDYDTISQQVIPRKYFSGGFSFANAAMAIRFRPASRLPESYGKANPLSKDMSRLTVALNPLGVSKSNLLSLMTGALVMAGGAKQVSAQDLKPLIDAYEQIKDIQTVQFKNRRVMDNLETARQRVENIQPGHLGYDLKEHILAIYRIMHDPRFRSALVNMPDGKGLFTFLNETELGRYYTQKRQELMVARYRMKREAEKLLIPPVKTDNAVPIGTPAIENQVGVEEVKPIIMPLSQGKAEADKQLSQEAADAYEHSRRVKRAFSLTTPSVMGAVRVQQEDSLRKAVLLEDTKLPTAVTKPINKENMLAHVISQQVFPIPVEDQVVVKNNGILELAGQAKEEYKQGELIFNLIDPELNSRVEQLTAEKEKRQEQLASIEKLFKSQQASYQELLLVKQKLNYASLKLARVQEEKVMGVITAPVDLQVKDRGDLLRLDGMKVNGGMMLFDYVDQKRFRVNFTAPAGMVGFNGIQEMSLNGEPVVSAPLVDWAFDPTQRNAQVSMVINVSAPMPSGKPVIFKASFITANPQENNLKSIIGMPGYTKASVREAQETVLKAPADGKVRFLVHEGQQVKAGEVLAVVEPKHYWQEYQEIRKAIEEINDLIHQGKGEDGIVLMTSDQVNDLRVKKFEYVSRLRYLEAIINRLPIRAQGNGVISKLKHYASEAFKSQDELIRMRTGSIFIGDIKGAVNPILFPLSVTVNNDDVVVVEAPSGDRFAGKVTAVNKVLQSPTMNMDGFQSVEVRVIDGTGLLFPQMPVRIIFPKDANERQVALNAWQEAEKIQRAPAAIETTQPVFQGVVDVDARSMPVITTGDQVVFKPKPVVQEGVALNEVDALVRKNRLISGSLTIEIQQKQLAEAAPKASRVSLTGAIYAKDGKVFYSGGLIGALKGLVGGTMQSGNAIGAAAPVVLGVAGNVMDWFTGKVGKEVELAKLMTKVASYHMQAELASDVNEAEGLFIDLGVTQERNAQLRELITEVEKAMSDIIEREKVGVSLTAERFLVQKSIDELNAQALALQASQETLTVRLNTLTGQSSTNLHQPFTVALPLGKDFPVIDQVRENQMIASLVDMHSPDPRMKQALALYEEAGKSLTLQGLKGIPTVTTTSVFLNDAKGFNPTANFVPEPADEGLLRSSRVTQGNNLGLQVTVPLLDQGVKIKTKVMQLELEKAKLEVEKTRVELVEELSKSVASIRSLSGQIQQAERAYQRTKDVWELKSKRKDINLSHQLLDERMAMFKAKAEVLKLKAQYLKAEAHLRKMGLLGAEVSTQAEAPVASFQTTASLPSTAVQKSESFPTTLSWTDSPLAGYFHHLKAGKPRGNSLAAGFVNFRVGPNIANTWALMQAGGEAGASITPNPSALNGIKDSLINDINISIRREALNHFLAEHQNSREFLPALKEIVLRSSHPEVVGELVKFMMSKEDHGLRFFVQVIHEALAQNNHLPANLCFQAIGDVFIGHPQVLEKLASVDFSKDGSTLYPDVSPDTADKVFLTFLVREPTISVAKARFLQSNYWGLHDLAKHYQQLTFFIKKYKGQDGLDRVQKLADAFYSAMLRQEALRNVEDVFRPGNFEHLNKIGTTVFDVDILSYVNIKENSLANRSFLVNSMEGIEAYIHPQVFVNAKQSVDSLLREALKEEPSQLFYKATLASRGVDELGFFFNLGLDAQKEYIAQSSNISELARILVYHASLRANALDRLMKISPQGQFLVLKAYLDSADNNLLRLIETRPWAETLRKSFVSEIRDEASKNILRMALAKFYQRTHEEWALNLRLATFSTLELHLVYDPRGESLKDAQINMAATERALKFIYEKLKYSSVFWAGYSLQTPGEIEERENLGRIIEQAVDPRVVERYITSRMNALKDGKARRLLEAVVEIRDKIARDIRKNDQTIPKFPLFLKAISMLAGLYPLTVIGKKLYRKYWKSQASDVDLILDLQDKLIGNDDKKTDGAMITPPKRVLQSTETPLKKWHSLILKWHEQGELPAQVLLDDLNVILVCAEEVLRKMPYSSDLMWHEGTDLAKNDMYQRTFFYFNLIAIKTLSMLNGHLQEQELSQLQRLKMEDDTSVLLDNINYGMRFSRVLSYRGSIEKVMSYKFAEDHFTERTKIYPLIRTILLYQRIWKKSEKGLNEELPELLREGNSLIDDFYENPQRLISESLDLLKKVTEAGRTAYDPISRDDRTKFRMSSFWRRSVALVGFSATAFTAGCILMGVPNVSFTGLSLMGAFTIGFSYLAYWHPHLDILKMEWNTDMVFTLDRIRRKLGAQLNSSGIIQAVNRNREGDIVALSQQEGVEQVRQELDLSHPPDVDAIVIVAQDSSNLGNLEEYAANRRGKLIREDIPVVVMASSYQGSGNVYLDALDQVKRRFESGEWGQGYSSPRTWEKSRVMFIFHGEEASRYNSIQYSLLDLGIANGYRTARRGSSALPHKPGHILIYTDNAYFGPIPEFPAKGITALASRVNSRVLTGGSLVDARFSDVGQFEIRQLLEGVDVESLQVDAVDKPHEGKVLDFLGDNFNLHNASINQYPALSGIYLMGEDAVGVFTKIAEFVSSRHLGERLRLSLTSDLLVLMVMRKAFNDRQIDEEIGAYLRKRVRWEDVEGGGKKSLKVDPNQVINTPEVESFYTFLKEACKGLNVHAFLPYSKSAVYLRIAGASAQEQALRFRRLIKNVGTASPAMTHGGIDLSGARNLLSDSQAGRPMPALLQSFEGFEFNIILYQPIINPVELFIGSSKGQVGSWFSNKSFI